MILDPSGTLNANVNASGLDLVGSSGIVSLFSSSSLFLYCSDSFLICCSSYFRSSSAFFFSCFISACLSASLNAYSWTSLNLQSEYWLFYINLASLLMFKMLTIYLLRFKLTKLQSKKPMPEGLVEECQRFALKYILFAYFLIILLYFWVYF